MLKALELVGFKSFADRTRFEFPPGISVVVGPNGSGKSNVVDALKWVLGEQNARSLRGREMADVIFNGSASRTPLNAAETTLTFDNSQGLLPIDTPEVHITRRVYRSGEGEYLINRQPCRLRDIRELFSGTGIATEAYSVIEQGKVDVLLQSSPRDRRLIFEEAAGISRFKAKKIECLRRLERVEQNLVRLSDIVEEVDHQLRSLRRQAAKAQRYQELAERLKSLRTQLARVDWWELGGKLHQFETRAGLLVEQERAASAQATAFDAQALELDAEVGRLNEALALLAARGAENREQIASAEATIDHERQRGQDLEQEIGRHQRHLLALNVRAGDLEQQLAATETALAVAAQGCQATRTAWASEERALAELVARCDALRAEDQRARQAVVDARAALAALERQASALESEETSAQSAEARCQLRGAESDQALRVCAEEALQLARLQAEADERRAVAADNLAEAEIQLSQLQAEQTLVHDQRDQLRQQHRGKVERAALLEELEQRWEGLGAGVKEVLVRAKAAQEGPFCQVRGLVADLLQVQLEAAPLVDLALGDAAQHLVVAPGQAFQELLAAGRMRLPGRVSFLPLDWLDPQTAGDPPANLDGLPGVIARADRVVETAEEFRPLVRRLLGRTWLVERLEVAWQLAAGPGRGQWFVTRSGETLSPEGVVTIGSRQASLGLVSRRSELRALRAEAAEIETRVAEADGVLTGLVRQIDSQRRHVDERRTQLQRVDQERTALDVRGEAVAARQALARQVADSIAAESRAATEQLQAARLQLAQLRQRLGAAEETFAACQEQGQELSRQFDALEARRAAQAQASTATQVELAKSEERLANLETQRRQLQGDQLERQRALVEAAQQLHKARGRLAEAEANVLAAESLLAELYLRKESLACEAAEREQDRHRLRDQRLVRTDQAQRMRTEARRLADELHALELAASELRLQREALVARLREDYGLDLESLAAAGGARPPAAEGTADESSAAAGQEEAREPCDQPASAEPGAAVPPAGELTAEQRAEIEREVAELRQKLNQLGHVNLDALDELAELETRHASLVDQLRDLTSAKNSLEQIINRINADSRRLFTETFETVRGHFQELFRKLFGGGQADVLLDEGVDILESGIEIVARPPGKEPRNISLLSGGEKTLTCVALLLAVFRSRPSPFCVLDEVDAALDEANIERFTGVLREFLAWTQFVIVTHSKKTMTSANTLYGVTMQESGVSKRVSVRFEDVSENGEIRLNPSSGSGTSDDHQAA